MQAVIPVLKQGGVAVIPTDTIYGIVGSAGMYDTYIRVCAIKHRNPLKTCIVLIGTVDDIFDDDSRTAFIKARELSDDGPTSIIVPAGENTPDWLVAADGTIAYRLPADRQLQQFLIETGPLVAPSANPEGETPAATIDQAIAYFEGRSEVYGIAEIVDAYVDAGRIENVTPSRIMKVEGQKVEYLR